ncbi:alpha-glucuronidase [Natronobacillus azotifigens]|uniref:Xylan alpha-1,2-glucuronidase n=1 Tax=Natronobacillus azotifigens TaxID=472978 RepID=A0A9J6RFS9_9BACI|nr:alpha-glucuronidase family glycosyl hydrolase [Natronobacillus azotifigens]MCZ0704278.1 alpha-glucuronidase family glycosyl hydrolase [Natronobacillus azotifigens]
MQFRDSERLVHSLTEDQLTSYRAWLQYNPINQQDYREEIMHLLSTICVKDRNEVIDRALDELSFGLDQMIGYKPAVVRNEEDRSMLIIMIDPTYKAEMYTINLNSEKSMLRGGSSRAILYGVFHLLRLIQQQSKLTGLSIKEVPKNAIRMINQWDDMNGSVERGYAGESIFYKDYQFSKDRQRIYDYARLLSSVGINAITINNVNVHQIESKLITDTYLAEVKQTSDIFNQFGITLFLSINYAAPIEIGGLDSADPLDPKVRAFWKDIAQHVYEVVPNLGGFLVKADSENRPGPFTYGRNHAEGANMLAEAMEPYGGKVIWRCFVYNCKQDWRDRTTDRARAAYDHFMPLDGSFNDNVVLQIKNGPMDFQVREPVSPLIGGLEKTNQFLEFQIAQEYLGQQRHLVYLIPQWKEVLEFDTFAKGEGTTVKQIVSGDVFDNNISGIVAVSNIGNDYNWTGHTIAQLNLYGYGRLIWNPDLTAEEIALEWIKQTFGNHPTVIKLLMEIVMPSWETYENYTSPLGIGWMVNVNHHYGPNIDGYEYMAWGTYHFADRNGLGVDRTQETGTGYTSQYHQENQSLYEQVETCPDELLLFFHHVPYTHKLKSGKTVIQHIYDTHFQGVEQVQSMMEKWEALSSFMDAKRHQDVQERLNHQLENAKEWRDIINTYFYRKSGIADRHNRTIY